MIEVVTVPAMSVEVALPGVVIDMPALAMGGLVDGQLVGFGGLAWGSGRCWLWFRADEPEPRYAIHVVRSARKLLRKAAQLGETEVFTVRDRSFETSERLCKMCGFELLGIENGEEVWHVGT